MIINHKRHRGHELNSANNYTVTRRRENIFVVFGFLRNNEQRRKKLKQTNAKERNIKEETKKNKKTRETKTCGEKKTKRRESRNIFGVFSK